MIPDAHTPCPACRLEWRQLYAAAKAVVDGGSLRTAESLLFLDACVRRCAPLVDLHTANQDHALSDELAEARRPREAPVQAGNGAGEVYRCAECDFSTTVLDELATHVAQRHP